MRVTHEALSREIIELALDLREVKRLLACKKAELRAEDERAERYKGYLDDLRVHLGLGDRHYGNIIDCLRALDYETRVDKAHSA